jgi:hypothetical protein
MGTNCCGNSYNVIGEEFVKKVLKDESLKLKNYDYIRLLNSIADIRVQQEIFKVHIDEYLIPSYYKENANSEFQLYVKSIFDYIMSQLKEKNNMYIVLMYFYVFINHENEKVNENLFSIFRYIAQILTVEDLKFWLTKYITFCTKGITFTIWQKCNDTSISQTLDELNTNVYSEQNIKKLVSHLLRNVEKEGEKSVVKLEQFQEMCKNYDLSSYEGISSAINSVI